MFIREDAKDLAKDLAAKGLNKTKIKKELEKQGMAGLLQDYDLEVIMAQAGSAREIMRKSPGTLIYRVVGVAAILGGLWIIFWMYGGNFSSRGIMLLIAGLVLTFKPEYANDKL
ncbi:hypothetical protein [Haloferula sp. BvORR071]|uniref:hypothetical protein n=1 Tax=Haloferula sp. BvORR071 TaxID=1396141 RepID=UPI00054D829F|nr:hypothetical protein [Haloferula sp. BvORR071]